MKTEHKIYNILVVEDNTGDFTLVEEFLLEHLDEFTVVHAKSFKNARQILLAKTSQFDVILLDLSLPDKTGLLLIQEIIAISFNIPIIVLTEYADIAFSIKSLSLGICDYILKDDLASNTLYKSIIYSTERKKYILALKESEKNYSELFHLSPQPMWVFDLEALKFCDVNKAAIEHYGYSREEFLLMSTSDLCSADDSCLKNTLTKENMDKSCTQGLFIHMKKDGELIQVDIQSNLIEFKGKNAKVILANDVTERSNHIKAIEAQNKKLTEISWIQSHLVRAPVAKILGLIQLINDFDQVPAEEQKILDYLLLSANELDDVIKNITKKGCKINIGLRQTHW